MPRELFDRELQQLRDEVMLLGSMTEKAIRRSVYSLRTRDLEVAERIINEDIEINRKRFQIEEECLRCMATQAPMAADLRAIVAVLYIIADLERMADHAEGIARITVMMGDQGSSTAAAVERLTEMSEKAIAMLNGSIEAFIAHDNEAARRISNEDDEVDAIYDSIYGEVIGEMIREPSQVTPLTYVLWAAHNLERIADRATNICERTIFLSTGHMEEINVSRY